MLPNVQTVIYNLTIPSSGQEITFRPFLVREHKTLLQALELKDAGVFVNTICNIIKSCVKEPIDIDDLTQFDVDYIFLNIRAKSVGEIVPVKYTCMREVNKKKKVKNEVIDPNNPDKKIIEETETDVIETCGTRINLQLDLSNIKVVIPTNYAKKRVIQIDENNGIKLKAPGFKYFRMLMEKSKVDGSVENMTNFENDLIFGCIESVFDKDKIYLPKSDFNLEEFSLFIERLPANALAEINNFFDEIPYVALQSKVTCHICGNQQMIELRTLEDFFV